MSRFALRRTLWVCTTLLALAVGLWLDGLDPQCSPGAGPVVRLTNTRGALLCGSTLPAAVETFLQVAGPTSRDVLLVGNDLRRATRAAQLSPEVPGDAVTLEANSTGKTP